MRSPGPIASGRLLLSNWTGIGRTRVRKHMFTMDRVGTLSMSFARTKQPKGRKRSVTSRYHCHAHQTQPPHQPAIKMCVLLPVHRESPIAYCVEITNSYCARKHDLFVVKNVISSQCRITEHYVLTTPSSSHKFLGTLRLLSKLRDV